MENRINSKELIRIKGHFQEKYGYEMDTFSSTILSEINQEFEKINTEMKAITLEINEASSKINGSIQHIQFTKSKVAFWYAAGSKLLDENKGAWKQLNKVDIQVYNKNIKKYILYFT